MKHSTDTHKSEIRTSTFRWLIAAGIVVLAAIFKTLPYLLPRLGIELDELDVAAYLWNFSPLLPVAVVLGASFSAPAGVLLAVAAWLLGDIGIGLASGHWEYAFYRGQPVVYLCLIMVVGLSYLASRWQQKRSLTGRIAVNLASGMVGAAAFFVVSNFVVWLAGNEAMYPHTLGGLLECYIAAIPFHRFDFVSMLVFVPVLTVMIPAPSEESAPLVAPSQVPAT